VLDDIHVSCSFYTQDQRPQDGTNIIDWLLGGGQSFLCFTSQLEGVGRILRATHVFLESTLDV
jgi:hypothetical protein